MEHTIQLIAVYIRLKELLEENRANKEMSARGSKQRLFYAGRITLLTDLIEELEIAINHIENEKDNV